MKRTLLVTALVALLSCGIASAVLTGSSTTKPTMRYIKAGTAAVVGSHFKSGERVSLTFQSGSLKFVRVANASSTGAFTINFRGLAKLKCAGMISLIAHGAKGDNATVTIKTTASCSSGGVLPAVSPTTSTTTTTPGMNPPPPYTT